MLMLISSAANHCLQLIWSGLTPNIHPHFQNKDCLFTNVTNNNNNNNNITLTRKSTKHNDSWKYKLKNTPKRKNMSKKFNKTSVWRGIIEQEHQGHHSWIYRAGTSQSVTLLHNQDALARGHRGRRRLHTLGDEHRCTQSGLGGPIGKEGQAGWHVRDQSFQNKAGSDEEMNRNYTKTQKQTMTRHRPGLLLWCLQFRWAKSNAPMSHI